MQWDKGSERNERMGDCKKQEDDTVKVRFEGSNGDQGKRGVGYCCGEGKEVYRESTGGGWCVY